LLYSVELQQFWIKLNRPDVSDWTVIQIGQILDQDSAITQVEYTLGKELLSVIYYSPGSKTVKARLFKVQPPSPTLNQPVLITRGDLELDAQVEDVSESDIYTQLNPLLLFSKNKVTETSAYGFISASLPFASLKVSFQISMSNIPFVLR